MKKLSEAKKIAKMGGNKKRIDAADFRKLKVRRKVKKENTNATTRI